MPHRGAHPRSDCIEAVLADHDVLCAVIRALMALLRDRTRAAYDPAFPRFDSLAHHVAVLRWLAPRTEVALIALGLFTFSRGGSCG